VTAITIGKLHEAKLTLEGQMMRCLARGATVLAILLVAASVSRADLLVLVTDGTRSNVPVTFGQSFTTPNGPSETNITFNFFSNIPPTTPYALGAGFLLGTPYTGLPSGLNPTTPGFLGETNASGGHYSFGSSVVLAGGTQYFFYETALLPQNAITGGGASYSGGNDYISINSGPFRSSPPFSANFEVTGTAVPEPSALVLGVLGSLGGLGWFWRRLLAAG
jgi:hypothetical protein